MKKDYIVPTVKVFDPKDENFICLSMIGEEGDGEQLINEGTFDTDFEGEGTIWDN